MSDEWTEVPGALCLKDTEKALLIRTNKGEEVWVPKKVVNEDESEVIEAGDQGTLFVKEWFAAKTDELHSYVG